MLGANFWQDKAESQKIIKEKKLFEDLINSYSDSVKNLNDLEDLYKLAYEEQTGKKINKMFIVRLPKTNEEFEAIQILYKKDHLKAFLGLLSCHKSELLFNDQMRKRKQLINKRKN